jgi:tetratricopeptide (TPR) repeat protein
MLKKHRETLLVLTVLLAIFGLYLYTTFPAYKNDDSPETVSSAYTLGISHPPGYPLFTMAGKIFSLLPLGSPAFRLNLFSICLAMLALLMFYFLVKQGMRAISGGENRLLALLAVFIPAFTYVFWNQAIEAKGGIYMLNILFLSALIYMSVRQLNAFGARRLYLLTYVFGLSLSNHWPSMAVFAPLLLYLFHKDRGTITAKRFALSLFFFLIGASAYLYLPVRGGARDALVFMARPDNLRDFLWTVLLSGYPAAVSPSLNLNAYQVKEMLAVAPKDFPFLWPLVPAGLYAMWRPDKKVLWAYLSVLAANLFIVTFTLRLSEQYGWAIGTFLMPSLLVLAVCAAQGAHLLAKFLNRKLYKNIFIFVLAAALSCTAFLQFKANNSRRNFLSYDFGNNIIRTLEPGSFYMPEGDFYVLPFIYGRVVERRAGDIKYLNVYSLQFQWGIDDFARKYGSAELKPDELAANAVKIVDRFAPSCRIYFSGYEKPLELARGGYSERVDGILYRMAKKEEHISPRVFELYSYRGAYDAQADYDRLLAGIYGGSLAAKAGEDYAAGDYRAAAALYERALLLPMAASKPDAYYNLSLCYRFLLDKDREIFCLKKTIELRPDFWPAYEQVGMLYYADRLLPQARDMFERAVKLGSPDTEALARYEKAIDSVGMDEQYGQVFRTATDLLAKQGKYSAAISLFDFLAGKNYRPDEIYKNIGVYNFKSNNFEEALRYFRESMLVKKSPEIYMSIAYTYYKMRLPDKALSVLDEGARVFAGNAQMIQMYNQIQREERRK